MAEQGYSVCVINLAYSFLILVEIVNKASMAGVVDVMYIDYGMGLVYSGQASFAQMPNTSTSEDEIYQNTSSQEQ